MNFQKTFILGRVSHTPELKALPNGNNVATFSMATNRVYKDASDQKKEDVEWHNCVAYGKLADIIGQYVEGGQVLFVEGRNKTRDWEDKTDGKKRYRTEVIIEGFQFGPKSQNREAKKTDNDNTPAVQTGGYTGDLGGPIDYGTPDVNIDDIPF